jgi:hypothetical protein
VTAIENIDPLLHTYDQITAFVKKYLPSLRAVVDKPHHPAELLAPQMAIQWTLPPLPPRAARDMGHVELLCAFSVLEHKHKNLQQRQKKTSKRGEPQGDGGVESPKDDRANQSRGLYLLLPCSRFSKFPHLCTMEGDSEPETKFHRGYATVPITRLGSKLIQGREPTVQGQANMMCSVVDSDSETHTPPAPPPQPHATNLNATEEASCAPSMDPLPPASVRVHEPQYTLSPGTGFLTMNTST